MSKATAVLFGIEDEFDVLSVGRLAPGQVKIVIESVSREGACPACGVVSGRVKDRPLRRIADLPASGQQAQLWWRKRRLVCVEALCPRRTFTQTSEAIRPRARVTQRLRQQLATAIAAGNRAVSEVAREYGVSWPTAHRALVAAADRWLPEPAPTTRLGIDETRFRSVRWWLDGGTWRRSDPWLTSFVDCSADGPGSLIGLAPGRTGGCVQAWLGEQTKAFRAAVELVVIDPSAPYASGIRTALPRARIAVDKWHLVALANQMVTEVRQRVQPTPKGRLGAIVAASLATGLLAALALVAAPFVPAKENVLDRRGPTGLCLRMGVAGRAVGTVQRPTPALGSCAGRVHGAGRPGFTHRVRRRTECVRLGVAASTARARCLDVHSGPPAAAQPNRTLDAVSGPRCADGGLRRRWLRDCAGVP